jgi:hypothetical protein
MCEGNTCYVSLYGRLSSVAYQTVPIADLTLAFSLFRERIRHRGRCRFFQSGQEVENPDILLPDL